jgi:hypothetical protein
VDIPTGVVGRIVGGQERGRFVCIIDDRPQSGGWLVLTAADRLFSIEVFDAWVADERALAGFFIESEWSVEWEGGG